jgi:acetyl esterase/lipase
MPLHPVAAEMVESSRQPGARPNAHLLPVEEARANFEGDFGGLPKPEVRRSVDAGILTRDGIVVPARVIADTDESGAPLVVFFHGGGWLLGSVDSHEMMARKIAIATGGVVVSVGYRRGPEARFPTATDDALDAVLWAVENADDLGADPAKLVLAGDSAGGNLAAVTAIRIRDEGGPTVAHQLLVYPVTTCDLSIGVDPEWDGVMLYRDELQWHQDNYLADPSQATDPHVAPLGADLAGLPPATVVLAECDPIRPQGRLYAEALAAAGVPVAVEEYPSMVHGFFGLEMLFPEAEDAMVFAGRSVRSSLGLEA